MKNTTRFLPIATALLLASAAGARNPVVLKLTDGNNAGPTGQNTGPGAEQATVVQSLMDGKRYVTTVWMSSQVSEADAPYQGKCSTVELDPITGPKVVVPPTQITALDGNRPFNHPHMDINPLTNQILLSYGSTNGNNNVQPYVQGFDVMCNATTNMIRLGNNNGNDGAPWAKLVNASTGLWQVGYLENNERSRAVGINFVAGQTELTNGPANNHSVGGDVLYNETIVDPANIGRPSVERFSDQYTIFCSSNGDNRPPEIGVACAMVDTLTGEQMWQQVIAASQPNGSPEYYMNQPVVALGENGRFYLQVERSNGNNGGNNRGATTTMLYTMQPDTAGPHTTNHIENVGLNQVHATTCSGKYGADGAPHVAVFDASITGSGFAAAQFAKFDVLAGNLTPVEGTKVLGGYNGDGGYLANLYGQNPNTQGREFMRCIGDIPNPGFGQEAGFLPSVKSFFAFPFAGRVEGEEKNSLFLSLLPAEEPTPAPVPNHDLTVTVGGDGRGAVFSSPLGIDQCESGVCTATFEEGLSITLTAAAAPGSAFTGWSGACTGTGGCIVPMTGAQTVTATFEVTEVITGDPVGLIVNVSGEGEGNISSEPNGVDCDSGTCAANFDRNTVVTLTARSKDGSLFAGWTGDCTNPNGVCVITLSAARNVSARFDIDPNFTPPPKKPGAIDSGDGDGGVQSCSSSGNGSLSLFAVALLGLALLKKTRRVFPRLGAAGLAVGLTFVSACAEEPKAPVIVSFGTAEAAVPANTPIQLQYNVRNAEAVTISVVGGLDVLPFSNQLQGSVYTPPVVTPTTYVLNAYQGDLLTSRTLSVGIVEGGTEEVPVVPSHASVSVFGVSTPDVETGGSATLSWQTVNAATGVILANDAVLTTIATADLPSGSTQITPAASTVYTINVTGADGQQVTMTTAISVNQPGVGPLTARTLFDSNVQGVLDSKCGACHEANNPSGYPDMFGATAASYYDRLVADTRMVPAVPEDSLLLLKGEHTGPAFLPAEAQLITQWLVKEATERGLGLAPPTGGGDFRPRTTSEALTRFGACMQRSVWDQTYGQGNNTQIARQGSAEGQCMACHSTGTAGAFLSASSGDTFDMNRLRPYVLKLVLTQSNEDGSFKDLVPARRFELKGSEGGDHPSYVLTQERLDAINSFVDQTLLRFRDYSNDCGSGAGTGGGNGAGDGSGGGNGG